MRHAKLVMMVGLFNSLFLHCASNTGKVSIRRRVHNPYAMTNPTPLSGAAENSSNNNDNNMSSIETTSYSYLLAIRQHCIEALQREKDKDTILRILRSVPPEVLNIHGIDGKTIAHHLFRTERSCDPIHEACALGLDFTKPTIFPDKYAGSTISHDLAGTISARHNPKYVHDQLKRLRILWDIDQGAHFNLPSSPYGSCVWLLLNKSGNLQRFIASLPTQEFIPEFFKTPTTYIPQAPIQTYVQQNISLATIPHQISHGQQTQTFSVVTNFPVIPAQQFSHHTLPAHSSGQTSQDLMQAIRRKAPVPELINPELTLPQYTGLFISTLFTESAYEKK